jgi:hypothetical protein
MTAEVVVQAHDRLDVLRERRDAAVKSDALDVERLARALVKATRQQAGEPDGDGWPGYVYFGKPRDVSVVLVVRELAEAIAREYDAAPTEEERQHE